MSNISEDRYRVVRDNNDLCENQGDATRDHTDSVAGANLTETPVESSETLRVHPKHMGDYNDNRSITKQIIGNFEPETVKPKTSRPAWRSGSTGLNVADRSTKLPETYRELSKLGVDFEDNQANFEQIIDVYNLEPVKPVASKSGMRTDRVDRSKRANAQLISRPKQPPLVNDLRCAPRTTAEGNVTTPFTIPLKFVTRSPHKPGHVLEVSTPTKATDRARRTVRWPNRTILVLAENSHL